VFWNVWLLNVVLYVVVGGLNYGCFVESVVFCVFLETAYL